MEFTPGLCALQINFFDVLELCESVRELTRERILVEFEPEIEITNGGPPLPPCTLNAFFDADAILCV